MSEIIRDFKYQLSGFFFFMVGAPIFAFLKPVKDGLAPPNFYFAACCVLMATIFLSMAFFDQGIHTIPKQEAKKERP
jgi:hypothetical protein